MILSHITQSSRYSFSCRKVNKDSLFYKHGMSEFVRIFANLGSTVCASKLYNSASKLRQTNKDSLFYKHGMSESVRIFANLGSTYCISKLYSLSSKLRQTNKDSPFYKHGKGRYENV